MLLLALLLPPRLFFLLLPLPDLDPSTTRLSATTTRLFNHLPLEFQSVVLAGRAPRARADLHASEPARSRRDLLGVSLPTTHPPTSAGGSRLSTTRTPTRPAATACPPSPVYHICIPSIVPGPRNKADVQPCRRRSSLWFRGPTDSQYGMPPTPPLAMLRMLNPCSQVLFKRKPVRFLSNPALEDESVEVGTAWPEIPSTRMSVCMTADMTAGVAYTPDRGNFRDIRRISYQVALSQRPFYQTYG